jgi:hypothetical protein
MMLGASVILEQSIHGFHVADSGVRREATEHFNGEPDVRTGRSHQIQDTAPFALVESLIAGFPPESERCTIFFL